ncbi:MAG TPA: amino acid adenylation domain-containing protein [Gammaproteobacteria bacterium]|nr:amino acid adenylation domain-containing protein [Gammaproteobacteria bacterium]
MTPKKSQKIDKPYESHYWEQLIENFFSHHSKMWLEDFETQKTHYQHKYFYKKIILDNDLIKAIQKFCIEKEITIFSVINAAWALLLNRYTTSDDIFYGTGHFCNNPEYDPIQAVSPLLPVRSIIHEEETIVQYLKNLSKELKSNNRNSKSYEYFFDKNDLFQNIFNYLLLYQKKSKFPNSDISDNIKKIEINPKTYPLVFLVQNKKLIKLALLCNEARFSKDSADSLCAHFKVILEKIIEDPDQLVTHYSILTKKERQTLLKVQKKSLRIHNSQIKNVAIHDLFTYQVKKTPQYIAIVHEDEIYTYKQLNDISNQIAHLLSQKKVRHGDTVAVLMERNPLLIATMLAIFKVGGIYVPIDTKYTDEDIEFILKDSNTHLILVNNTRRLPKSALYKAVIIDNNLSAIKHFPEQFPIAKLTHDDQLAYIIYMAEATGQLKGVMIKHASLVNLCNWYKTNLNVSVKDRASQFSSPGYDRFFCEVLPFITAGASIHIVNDNIKFTPSAFFFWLVKEKITICDLPTAYAKILFNETWPDKLSLRIVKIGGETLTHYPSQKFPFDIWNTYGPVEAAIETTYAKIYQANTQPEADKSKHISPPIGKPITNSELFVVDQHMELAPIGSVGELLIGGINVSPGYFNRPQLTKIKFIRNTFNENSDSKLFRTGDLVRWLKDGNLELIGKLDNQVKISGYRIDLNEVETALIQYPDVNEVIVLLKELLNGQKTLIAYLVPNLDRIRIPYQERCLISFGDFHYLQTLTEDISKSGVAITGPTDELAIGQNVKLNFKLPGFNESKWLTGQIIWQSAQRAGIQFDQTEQQISILQKSIQYFLTTHNLMDTLQSSAAKRSLRSALKNKLPSHMIPTIFSTLSKFPLTFNGKVDWKSLPPPKDFERILDRSYVEPRNATEKKIYRMWQEILGQEKISITDNFFDLGGNSQLIATLSIKILEKFNISLPEKILFDLPFIPIMAEYINSHGEKYTFKSSAQEDIHRDAILNDAIITNRICSQTLSHPKGILLTGSSGFLGIFLLKELLEQTDAKIYCLIRKGKFESIATRLLNNIEKYELTSEISLANRRIVMIPSDIGDDQFGLPTELYHNLASKVESIYHCGAQVNVITAYTNLRHSNVQGTLEVIKFALQKFDKPIHYISTLATANKFDEEGRLLEEFPDANSSLITGGYTTSKWVSERLLTQVKNRGLPVSIYRSGYIWGQSDSGVTNMNDALLLLIKGCIQLGFAPNWKEKITILPVNFVSKAIVGISLQQKDKSSVFHLDHPTGIMWTDLVSWLNTYGYSIKLCSHKEWLEKLMRLTPENALYPFLPHLLAKKEGPNSPVIDMDNTMTALNKAHLYFPDINNRLLVIYIRYLCEVGFLPEPENKRKQIFV